MTNAETQLAGYFAKYEPAMVKLRRTFGQTLVVRSATPPLASV